MAFFQDKGLLLVGRGEMNLIQVAEIFSEALAYRNKCVQIFQPDNTEPEVILRVAMRISSKPLPVCPQLIRSDYTIVFDDSLLEIMNVTEGLKKSGILLVNSSYSPQELIERFGIEFSTATVDAEAISLKEIGEMHSNICILGAFCRIGGEVSLEALNLAVSAFFSETLAQKIIRSMRKAYRTVKIV